jgi:hypothetical protein
MVPVGGIARSHASPYRAAFEGAGPRTKGDAGAALLARGSALPIGAATSEMEPKISPRNRVRGQAEIDVCHGNQ